MNKFLAFFGAFCLFGLCVVCIAVFLFPSALYLSKDTPVPTKYGILLLGSIPDRTLEIADLYHQKYIQKIIFVHENIELYKPLLQKGVQLPTESDLAKSSLLQLGVPEEDIIILPGSTLSTQDEAILVGQYIVQINSEKMEEIPKDILVVTSKFHSGRADRIFERVFQVNSIPCGIHTIPSPYDNSHPEKWFQNREDIADALIESLKLVNFWLFEQFQIPKFTDESYDTSGSSINTGSLM